MFKAWIIATSLLLPAFSNSAFALDAMGDVVAETPDDIKAEARWSRFERDRANAILARDFPRGGASLENANSDGAPVKPGIGAENSQ